MSMHIIISCARAVGVYPGFIDKNYYLAGVSFALSLEQWEDKFTASFPSCGPTDAMPYVTGTM